MTADQVSTGNIEQATKVAQHVANKPWDEPLDPNLPTAFVDYVNHMDKVERDTLEGKVMMGYPLNEKDISALQRLRCILTRNVVSNNCGDPFDQAPRPWLGNTLDSERNLLKKLMEPWGGGDQAWGYVTTGGTEGVTKGMHAGLRRIQDRCKRVMIIWCEQAHYSVEKAASLLLGQYSTSVSASIPPNPKGEMNLETLSEIVKASHFMHVDGFVVMATLGTTFLGANDDICGILKVFEEHNVPRENVHMHIDAALNGGWWNIADDTVKYKVSEHFDSLSISGHKWYGGFIGGMIMLAKPEEFGNSIKYVKMVDRMLSGSRDGEVAILWTARLLQFDWKKEYEHCRANAEYLRSAFAELGVSCSVQGLNVVFPKPSDEMTMRHQLMTVDEHAQIFSLPHITRSNLESFIQEYREELSDGRVKLQTTVLLDRFLSFVNGK